MTKPTVIRNALMVNEGQSTETDIFLKNGCIEKIASNFEAPSNAKRPGACQI